MSSLIKTLSYLGIIITMPHRSLSCEQVISQQESLDDLRLFNDQDLEKPLDYLPQTMDLDDPWRYESRILDNDFIFEHLNPIVNTISMDVHYFFAEHYNEIGKFTYNGIQYSIIHQVNAFDSRIYICNSSKSGYFPSLLIQYSSADGFICKYLYDPSIGEIEISYYTTMMEQGFFKLVQRYKLDEKFTCISKHLYMDRNARYIDEIIEGDWEEITREEYPYWYD